MAAPTSISVDGRSIAVGKIINFQPKGPGTSVHFGRVRDWCTMPDGTVKHIEVYGGTTSRPFKTWYVKPCQIHSVPQKAKQAELTRLLHATVDNLPAWAKPGSHRKGRK
jgi:hypothetical protein